MPNWTKLRIVYGFPLEFSTHELTFTEASKIRIGWKKGKLVHLNYSLFTIIFRSYFAKYFTLNCFVL